MTKMIEDSIGIDISKAHLDVYRLSDGRSAQFLNTPQGFKVLRKWVGNNLPCRVVYEATGPYHGSFERALGGHLPLVKVNPLQARRFAQARGSRARTDRADARMLAVMGEAFAPEPGLLTDKTAHELKELQIERTALIKDRTRLLNRIKTQTLSLTKRHSRARIAQIDRQLAVIDAEIKARLRKDESKARKLDILTSIAFRVKPESLNAA